MEAPLLGDQNPAESFAAMGHGKAPVVAARTVHASSSSRALLETGVHAAICQESVAKYFSFLAATGPTLPRDVPKLQALIMNFRYSEVRYPSPSSLKNMMYGKLSTMIVDVDQALH